MSVRLRRQLVAALGVEGAIADAFLAVPREVFVPEWRKRVGLAGVYEPQTALVTKTDAQGLPTSSSSAPAIMARMLEALALEPGQRVLEIGAGTGYNAALLDHIVGRGGSVTSIEIDGDTARRARGALAAVDARVRVVVGDGRLGCERDAPYDRIIVTAASPTIPRPWFDQLVDGGLLEVPYECVGMGAIPTLVRTGDGFETRSVVLGGFMGLRGAATAAAVAHEQVVVTERIGDDHRYESFSGSAVAALPRAARARLLHLLVDGPRDTSWREPDPTSFLLLDGPRSLQYNGAARGWGAGVVAPDGSAAAAVVQSPARGRRLLRWGDGADAVLERWLSRWRRRGHPTTEDVRFSVRYRGDDAVITSSWARTSAPGG